MAYEQGRSARRVRGWLLVLLSSTVLAGCGGGGGSSASGGNTGGCGSFDCRGMLDNLGNNVMLPTYKSFSTEAQAMSQAVGAYCAALGSENETVRRQEARQAWAQTMAVWQRAEVMQVGPLVDNSRALRDTIYSWPIKNSCGVDQDVVFADQNQLPDGSAYDISARTPDRRGLDALEYVLFNDNLDHSCPSNVEAVADWNARADAERRAARCTYAALAAQDLADQAQTLVARWDGSEDDFLRELTQPGTSGSRFASVEAAVNAVSDALFYVEKQTKDDKLAKPAGIQANSCGAAGTVCPAAVESPFSHTSKDHIRNNFVALQMLFLGNAPDALEERLGFDDYLDAAGDVNVSAVMEQDIQGAISAVDNIPGTLADAVVSNFESVNSAYGAAKLVTDRLKNDFLKVLGLSIPGSAAGDGD
jgi:predicted lipoprotein